MWRIVSHTQEILLFVLHRFFQRVRSKIPSEQCFCQWLFNQNRKYIFLGWEAKLNMEDELFTRYSLLVTFYSLLVTFYSLLVTTYSLLFTFYSLLVTFYSSLLTRYSLLLSCYILLVTRCFLLAHYYLLVTLYFTFHSSPLIRYSLLFPRYFCSLISTIYLLKFGSWVMLRTLI